MGLLLCFLSLYLFHCQSENREDERRPRKIEREEKGIRERSMADVSLHLKRKWRECSKEKGGQGESDVEVEGRRKIRGGRYLPASESKHLPGNR
jgi:hypothetical protein